MKKKKEEVAEDKGEEEEEFWIMQNLSAHIHQKFLNNTPKYLRVTPKFVANIEKYFL